MRISAATSVLATLLAGSMALSGSSVALAQDPACLQPVYAIPIESVDLPDGWTWDSLLPTEFGWRGSHHSPTTEYLSFSIQCMADAAGFLAAKSRTFAIDEPEARISSVVPVGDEVLAYSYEWEGYDAETMYKSNYITWRNDSVVAQVYGDEDADWSELEDLALAIDALLP